MSRRFTFPAPGLRSVPITFTDCFFLKSGSTSSQAEEELEDEQQERDDGEDQGSDGGQPG